jgi:3-hydroxybutyryl-CoA dehydrogenase
MTITGFTMDAKVAKPRTEIKKVGVVGCGLMGSQFTQVCAQRGYQVVVSEVSDELLNKGLALIKSRLVESVSKGEFLEKDKAGIVNRITGTANIRDFADCDLVIESATEKMEVKKKIFAELDDICPKDVVLGTNTSVLSILDMAVVTSRPDKILGIHGRPLVAPKLEVIETIMTSNEALEVAKSFAESLGKRIIIAKDTPGFIVNRLLTPFILNAIRMLESGIASRDDIDTSFTSSFAWSMGPLGMADSIGLDTLLAGVNGLYDDLKDPQFIAPTLLKKMVTAGWFGIKTGKGFYEY